MDFKADDYVRHMENSMLGLHGIRQLTIDVGFLVITSVVCNTLYYLFSLQVSSVNLFNCIDSTKFCCNF